MRLLHIFFRATASSFLADFDGIMETLRFACSNGQAAFAVFEFAAEALVVCMALPGFETKEGGAALCGRPKAPEGIVFGRHRNLLGALV